MYRAAGQRLNFPAVGDKKRPLYGQIGHNTS